MVGGVLKFFFLVGGLERGRKRLSLWDVESARKRMTCVCVGIGVLFMVGSERVMRWSTGKWRAVLLTGLTTGVAAISSSRCQRVGAHARMRTTKKGGGRKRESARLGLTHGEDKIKPERRDGGTGFKYYMKRQTRQEGMDGVVTGRLAISLARATRQ